MTEYIDRVLESENLTHLKEAIITLSWHCICSTHAIVTIASPPQTPLARATGGATQPTLHHNTRHP